MMMGFVLFLFLFLFFLDIWGLRYPLELVKMSTYFALNRIFLEKILSAYEYLFSNGFLP